VNLRPKSHFFTRKIRHIMTERPIPPPPPLAKATAEERKKSKMKKRNKKHVSSARGGRKKTGMDSFPEMRSLPAFTDEALLFGGSDDDSFTSLSSKYTCKEDQDVAVFMSIANRMDLSSLLFILQGHAREMNLPSAEYLRPEMADQRAQVLAAAQKKAAKKFGWKDDADGKVQCQYYEIDNVKECPDMWWNDEEMHKILTGAIIDVKYYQENKQEFIQAVEILATQPDEGTRAHEAHLKTLIVDRHARGLEVHIVGYLEELRHEYINAVLDEQDDCEEVELDYETTADRIRARSLQYSTQSQDFAKKLAKCDHIVALKASLSKWEAPKKKPSKAAIPNPQQAVRGCKEQQQVPSGADGKQKLVVRNKKLATT
jgi:hypothetical protein